MVLKIGWNCLAALLLLPAAAQSPDMEQARSLARDARSLSYSHFRTADSLYTRALEIAQTAPDATPECADFLQGLAEVRIRQQRFDTVEAILDRVVDIRRQSAGERSIAYADALSMQGWYYAMRADFVRSEKVLTCAAEIISDLAPDSYEQAKVLHRTFFLHYYKQDKAAADSCCRRAIAIYERTAAPTDRNLIEMKGSQAIGYIPGRIKEAEQIIIGLLPVIEQNYGKEDYTYSTLVMTLASIYAFDGRTEQALPLFEESGATIRHLFGERHEAYYNALNNQAMIYMRTERFAEAEALLLRSLHIRKELTGTENPAYLKALNNLATMYLNMGSYKRASEMFGQVAELSERLLGGASRSYLLALANLGLCQMRTGERQAAIATADKCEQSLQRYTLTDNRDFADIHALNLLTAMHCGKNDPRLGSKIAESAATLKTMFGERNTTYLNAINGLAGYYLRVGSYIQALEYATQDAEFTAKYRGKETSAYMKALSNKAAAYYLLHRWPEAESTLAECLDVARWLAAENLAFMSDREREDYWQAIRQPLDNISGLALLAERYDYDSPTLRGLLYDRVLLTKSLLLNYSINIRQSVLESGDDELISIWHQLKKLKSASSPNTAKIEELEKHLARLSMPYRKQRHDFSVTWQDVQAELADGESAVEIAAITGEAVEPHYTGLVLRPGDKSPRRVMLGSEEFVANALQAPYTAGHLLFTPLEKQLRGVKRIYLSTSGIVNRIPFAWMQDGKGYLIDRYSICNVLSTKDIAMAKQRLPLSGTTSIALFGGADFGLPAAELKRPENTPELLRGQGFDYLPGSEKEVTHIGEILAGRGWQSAVYTDKQATESRFKALSSASPDIIHISTHGYYFPPNKADSGSTTTLPFKTAADPLIRSGLLFSGANDAWQGRAAAGPADDGILTGYEISLMDLSHTRLVVLSACRTGLGDNDYSEGLYGLQRAFRIAGAQALLVALREIPDRETTQFMTEFYEHLAEGSGIRDAFDATMRAMREQHPYDPGIWAAFMLIE